MKKIIVIGCGFAGLTVAEQLSSFGDILELTVIDKNPYFNFLPSLPDVIGRDIRPGYLSYPIKILSRKLKFNFIEEQATAVDLRNNTVSTARQTLKYDYLVIASGTETNFYGNNEIRQNAYKLDDTKDAGLILDALQNKNFDHYIISGAGYTGIEIAVGLRAYLRKRLLDKPVLIVEKGNSLLGPLPEWIKEYTLDNLRRLDVRVLVNSAVAKVEPEKITLSSQDTFANAMLIWTAGVKTPDFVRNLNVDKTPQGRLKVDEYLRVNDNCFAAGDSAYFAYKGAALRMAVQFAIMQGISISRNILRLQRGMWLHKYRPYDLGYIIPMANNKSCGRVLGINVKGVLPTFLHYAMVVYRSYGFRNKFGIIFGLFRPKHR
ncbi:MAG: FAD-dependent oxidoreductase [Candidatus Omnitrophica bacterium]|nr:FAD-dependent oxidoreductase [Candidatus Omnitrophota bacterium]